MRSLDEACASRTEPSRFGTAFFNDSFPKIYVLNFLRADYVPTGAAAADIAEEAEDVHARAVRDHRRVSVYEEWGADLVEGFAALGWTTECDVIMIHRGQGAISEHSELVKELEPPQLRQMREKYIRTQPHGKEEDVVRQLLDKDRLFERAANARHLGAVVDGDVVCACDLYSDGRTAQIEDVATLEEHRRRGYASAVVRTAVHEARTSGHELIFLLADEADRAKDLYLKLDFEVAGRIYDFWNPA
jgi:ribosomal protein S18 acetylase RimI-like enzyme